MKILILSTFDTFGGAAIAATRLYKALKNYGLDSTMLVQEKKDNDISINSISNTWLQKQLSKIRFIADRFQFLFYEKSKSVRFSFSQSKIGVDISENSLTNDADILHLHWVNFGFLSINSINKLIATQKPIVWTLHDMWVFTGGCHYAGECTNFHNSCGVCENFLKNPKVKDLSNQVWNNKNKIFKDANITLVGCSKWLSEIAKSSSLLKEKTIMSIPNPININLFLPKNKLLSKEVLNLKTNRKYILIGAVNLNDGRKGFKYLIEALFILSNNFQTSSENIDLLIFGKATQTDFENLPLKVNFLGQIADQEQIINAYNAASVFVIPSLEENLPNTIMESMACGTPVVGFDVGGIPEMIDHKKTGYLAKYKDAEDLAAGIYHILFEADYDALSKNTRQKVVENYSEEIVAKQYENLYKSLLQ